MKIPRIVVSCVLLPAVIKDSWQELTSLLSYIPASYHVHDIILSDNIDFCTCMLGHKSSVSIYKHRSFLAGRLVYCDRDILQRRGQVIGQSGLVWAGKCTPDQTRDGTHTTGELNIA